MKALILILLLAELSEVCVGSSRHTSKWRTIIAANDSVVTVVNDSNRTFVSFADVILSTDFLDSISNSAIRRNREVIANLNRVSLSAVFGNRVLLCAPIANIVCDNTSFDVVEVFMSKGESFFEQNCVLFYYVPGLGVIAAFDHKTDEHIFRDWDRYVLHSSSFRNVHLPEFSRLLPKLLDAVYRRCGCDLTN